MYIAPGQGQLTLEDKVADETHSFCYTHYFFLKFQHGIQKSNKRAMMALNSLPEFKNLNPKPSAAELFGT